MHVCDTIQKWPYILCTCTCMHVHINMTLLLSRHIFEAGMATVLFLLSLRLLILSKVTCQEELETLSGYSTYKLIKDAVLRDPEQLFKMRKAFFPATNERFWQVDAVDVIYIKMCVTMDNSSLLPQCEGESGETDRMMNATSQQCWSFQWTNSRLFNLISGEILLAMDVVTTRCLYPEIIGSVYSRKLVFNTSLNMNTTTLKCQPSSSMMEQAITHFLSWVSKCHSLF